MVEQNRKARLRSMDTREDIDHLGEWARIRSQYRDAGPVGDMACTR